MSSPWLIIVWTRSLELPSFTIILRVVTIVEPLMKRLPRVPTTLTSLVYLRLVSHCLHVLIKLVFDLLNLCLRLLPKDCQPFFDNRTPVQVWIVCYVLVVVFWLFWAIGKDSHLSDLILFFTLLYCLNSLFSLVVPSKDIIDRSFHLLRGSIDSWRAKHLTLFETWLLSSHLCQFFISFS